MIRQRPIDLNPDPNRLEVIKVSYPPVESRRRGIYIQPMRFIRHDGRASQ